jgi:hypothetical protein
MRTDGQTDVTKLTVAFRNLVTAHKNLEHGKSVFTSSVESQFNDTEQAGEKVTQLRVGGVDAPSCLNVRCNLTLWPVRY